MDKVIKINTDGLRTRIARDLQISSQGLASKLGSNPLSFLVSLTKSLKTKSEQNALNLYADIRARFEAVLFPAHKKFSLIEVVETWQKIFVEELKFPDINRWNLLQQWRILVALGNLRICELTEALEEKRFGYSF